MTSSHVIINHKTCNFFFKLIAIKNFIFIGIIEL